MCLCIVGIAIFITLIVDINKYISMMKEYWQKGGTKDIVFLYHYKIELPKFSPINIKVTYHI